MASETDAILTKNKDQSLGFEASSFDDAANLTEADRREKELFDIENALVEANVGGAIPGITEPAIGEKVAVDETESLLSKVDPFELLESDDLSLIDHQPAGLAAAKPQKWGRNAMTQAGLVTGSDVVPVNSVPKVKDSVIKDSAPKVSPKPLFAKSPKKSDDVLPQLSEIKRPADTNHEQHPLPSFKPAVRDREPELLVPERHSRPLERRVAPRDILTHAAVIHAASTTQPHPERRSQPAPHKVQALEKNIRNNEPVSDADKVLAQTHDEALKTHEAILRQRFESRRNELAAEKLIESSPRFKGLRQLGEYLKSLQESDEGDASSLLELFEYVYGTLSREGADRHALDLIRNETLGKNGSNSKGKEKGIVKDSGEQFAVLAKLANPDGTREVYEVRLPNGDTVFKSSDELQFSTESDSAWAITSEKEYLNELLTGNSALRSRSGELHYKSIFSEVGAWLRERHVDPTHMSFDQVSQQHDRNRRNNLLGTTTSLLVEEAQVESVDPSVAKLGIQHLTPEQQDEILDQVFTLAGEEMAENLTDEQLNEYEKIINADDEVIGAWLAANEPDYEQNEVYQAIADGTEADPEHNDPKKIFANLQWVAKNIPNRQTVLDQVIAAYKEGLGDVDEMSATIEEK